MQDRLEAMRIFLRVAELGSFTGASDSLGISRTQVSKTVQQLEQQWQVRLLQRTTRKVRLTLDGEQCLQRCQALLSDYSELEELFLRRERSLSGRIRIDMSQGFARHLLFPALQAFMAQHPQLILEISSTDRKVDIVAEGFDAVLRIGKLEQEGVVAKKLGYLQQVSVASASYIQRCGIPQTLRDLAQHQLVQYVTTFGDAGGFEYLDGQTLQMLPMPTSVFVNNSDAYVAACCGHLGIIQSPLLGLNQYLKTGELQQILPDIMVPSMPVYLLYPHRRHLSQRLRLLSDWLTQLLATGEGIMLSR
jgi:DNA-binding transcriptional LysR family regulator